MTRKRYVKLLMAEGYDRNEAALQAQKVIRQGSTYQGEYIRLKYFAGIDMPAMSAHDVDAALARISAAIPGFIAAVGRMVSAIAAGLSAFNETYQNAMKAEAEKQEKGDP